MIAMPKNMFMKEHSALVHLLQHPSKKALEKEAIKQKKEMSKYLIKKH